MHNSINGILAQESIGSINPDHLTFDDVVSDLAPTPKPSKGKAIKRRSRASKKAPTTLLTADANNFRALVQQFTGCHSATTPLLAGAYKGPINLNFEKCSYYPRHRASEQQERLLDYHKQQQQLPLHEARLGHDESLSRINNMSAAAAISLDHDDNNNGDQALFADQNPRSDALTYGRGQELADNYETMLDDDFWGDIKIN